MSEAVIVSAVRTAVGKAPKGTLRNTRPDDMAAAVIGGTSIFGGIGTYSGTIFGALILGVLATTLTFLDAGQAIQQIVYGSIVLALAWLYARITTAA